MEIERAFKPIKGYSAEIPSKLNKQIISDHYREKKEGGS